MLNTILINIIFIQSSDRYASFLFNNFNLAFFVNFWDCKFLLNILANSTCNFWYVFLWNE